MLVSCCWSPSLILEGIHGTELKIKINLITQRNHQRLHSSRPQHKQSYKKKSRNKNKMKLQQILKRQVITRVESKLLPSMPIPRYDMDDLDNHMRQG